MGWAKRLLRRKALDTAGAAVLERRLSLTDLTLQGIGATLGAGAYVITGTVASVTAGPAVVCCFFIAGCASVLSAMLYAEFAARAPRAGSAYAYSYSSIGELGGWLSGWNLLLEYIIGAATVSRSFSGYVNVLSGGRVNNAIAKTAGRFHVPGLGPEPDFLAFGVVLAMALVVAVGVRESSQLNNALTCVNITVLLFVVLYGLSFANGDNLTPYAPFGVSGVFRGAATCFTGFIGFDVIATSAEEALNPQVAVPRAIMASLLFSCIAYMAVSGTLTLMVNVTQLPATTPQLADVGGSWLNAPLATAFVLCGASWARYLVAPGALSGLSTSLLNTIHPMPRILLAVSRDGLLPAWLGAVSPRFKTPVLATLLSASVAALLACVFDVKALAQMMSCGTLSSYTLVACSVLVLRARAAEALEAEAGAGGLTGAKADERRSRREGLTAESLSIPLLLYLETREGGWSVKGYRPAAATALCLAGYVAGCALVSVASVLCGSGALTSGRLAAIILGFLCGAPLAVASGWAIFRIPSLPPLQLSFHVPRGRAVALASIALNTLLLASLPVQTWERFLVWLGLGLLLYSFYGCRHSKLETGEGEGEAKAGEPEEAAPGSEKEAGALWAPPEHSQ